MPYEMIRIPLAKTTFDSTKAELRAYFDWHQRSIPARLEQLTELVRSWPPTSAWQADKSRESLLPLGQWLAAHIDFEDKPAAELARQRALLPPGTPISTHEPSMRMRSIAYDIGIYFGECMISAFPQLSWQLVLDSKRNVDYGQAVIHGFRAGGHVLNPARVVLICTLKLQRGNTKHTCLQDLLSVWSAYL